MPFVPSDMKLSSSAFEGHGKIPTKYTQEGANVSPELRWTDPPAEAKSFAIVCHDPDAPLVKNGTYGFVHWVLYNLPGNLAGLDEGTDRGTPGANDGGGQGYTGPMPPEGHGTHHYFFWVIALDAELDLEPGLTLWEFLAEAERNVIAMNRLVGTYRRG